MPSHPPSPHTPAKKYVAPPHFCAACRKRGKTWNGGDPECAFQHGKPFSVDNWNCATAGMVRDLFDFGHDEPGPDGITLDWSAGGDQSIAMIRLDNDYDYVPDDMDCLYVTWYKRRGRTGGMWLIGDEDTGPPRPPTEAEVLAIVRHYSPEKIEERRKRWSTDTF